MNQFAIYHKEDAQRAFCKHYKLTEEQARNTPLQPVNVRQLGAMQAWIITDSHGNKWLQSYNTIVSVKWADTGEFERLGKWSVSTSRQQTRFEREV